MAINVKYWTNDKSTELKKQVIFNNCKLNAEVLKLEPGGHIKPHRHLNCDTIVYILEGKGFVLYGEKLERRTFFVEGAFLYVPQGEMHQPFCTGDKPLISLIFRNSDKENVSN